MPPLGPDAHLRPNSNRRYHIERIGGLEGESAHLANLLDEHHRSKKLRILGHSAFDRVFQRGELLAPYGPAFSVEYKVDAETNVRAVYKVATRELWTSVVAAQTMALTDNGKEQLRVIFNPEGSTLGPLSPVSEKGFPFDPECLSVKDREEFAENVLDTMYLIAKAAGVPDDKLPSPLDWNPAITETSVRS